MSGAAGPAAMVGATGVYPSERIVSWRAAGPVTRGRYSTVACSVARLTEARMTPSTACNPCSILATHEAQDMPSIGIVRHSAFVGDACARRAGRAGAILVGADDGGRNVTGCAGWKLLAVMPRGPFRRTASGSAWKVRLQPGAQK